MKKLLFTIFLLLSSIFTVLAQPTSDKLIREGVKLHDKKRYKDAIECYKKALEINPSSMSATYEMSLSYMELKDYDNSLKYSTKVINANFQPLLMDAYIVKGSTLAEMNKLDQSIQILNEAVDKCGSSYLLYFNLGLSHFKKGNNQQAINNLAKAIEIDATQPSVFLLYAYALNDADKWIQSFYAFHFFLLLEPNTARSKEAFEEMYDIISANLGPSSPRLTQGDGMNRKYIYNAIQRVRPALNDEAAKFKFFEDASKTIFFSLSQMQADDKTGMLWDFFVPTYTEILESGYFDVYCRYVSAGYFPESLSWWNINKDSVDHFIEWFEHGQGSNTPDDEAEYGDDSDLEEDPPTD